MAPEIPGESLAFQRAYNGWYESTALQRLTCLLPPRGVPLPNRSHGWFTHPPIHTAPSSGRASVSNRPARLIFLTHHYHSALHYPLHVIEHNVDVRQGIALYGGKIRKISGRHCSQLFFFPQ